MATKAVSIEPVMKAITVACTPEEAFRYFTAEFGMWWPIATHSVVAYASEFRDKPASVILEPRVSGRIFERSRAGGCHASTLPQMCSSPERVRSKMRPLTRGSRITAAGLSLNSLA